MAKQVLIVGSGGREHALGWKLAQSPLVEKFFFAPGNGGTSEVGTNVAIAANDVEALVKFALDNHIDLTVVGPDDSLAAGIVDVFQAKNLRIFGPSQSAARIESSKSFSKQLMRDQDVPTAAFRVFKDYERATSYLKSVELPIVIKAAGLALGKGVFICHSQNEAAAALKKIMQEKAFGLAGTEVVIEEYLAGQEVSIHALCDGTQAVVFPSAQDHKQALDGDKGPNTGGMGTITPVPWFSNSMLEEAQKEVVEPILEGLLKQSAPFVGCLYPGLMITNGGQKVLEYNARFGDPETQAYMRLLKSDLLPVLEACIDGELNGQDLVWRDGFAVCIVLASGGYPGEYKKGLAIEGIDIANRDPGVEIFHAGTKLESGEPVTNGGRVLSVTAVADTLDNALQKAYTAVTKINFEGMQYRTDIGFRVGQYA